VVVGTLGEMLAAPWASLTSGRKVLAGGGNWRPEDLSTLAGLAEGMGRMGSMGPVLDSPDSV
jgi:hypothetical protein